MKLHNLLLVRHTGAVDHRLHDGRVAVERSNIRWCSDGFEIGCDNKEKVRVAFALDCCDREAIAHVAPPMESFRRGRDFAAWLGLVPRQHSSGGKERLGRISKAEQADIRRLLIMGAMSRLNWLGRRTIPEGAWLSRMLARKPRMLVAIALANKMARAIWTMLTTGKDYVKPARTAAA